MAREYLMEPFVTSWCTSYNIHVPNLGTWNKILAHSKVSNFIILKIQKNIQFRSGKFGALPIGRADK